MLFQHELKVVLSGQSSVAVPVEVELFIAAVGLPVVEDEFVPVDDVLAALLRLADSVVIALLVPAHAVAADLSVVALTPP